MGFMGWIMTTKYNPKEFGNHEDDLDNLSEILNNDLISLSLVEVVQMVIAKRKEVKRGFLN